MTGMLPGPINLTFFAIIVFTLALTWTRGGRPYRLGGYALLINILFAWIATYTDITIIAALSMIGCAILCIYGNNRILDALAVIYVARVLLVAAHELGAIGYDAMWALTEVPLTLQILIMWGAIGWGGFTGADLGDRDRRSGLRRFIASRPTWTAARRNHGDQQGSV